MNIDDFLDSCLPPETALLEYASLLSCYEDASEKAEVFIKYYDIIEEQGNKTVRELAYSRGDFLRLVTQVISLFTSRGIGKGSRVLHNFSGNRIEDVIIRAAAVFLGFVPVTVNWQADSADQIKYKLVATEAKIVVFDDESLAMNELKSAFPYVQFLHCKEIYQSPAIEDFLAWIKANSDLFPLTTDTRCIIFTSGTTGNPKGVRLSYSNYNCNRYTFEQFLELQGAHTRFVPVIVNPLHHTNSTSISDWALRRSNTTIHLVEKYTSQFWAIVVAAVGEVAVTEVLEKQTKSTLQEKMDTLALERKRRVVVPLVSRHIDFLENLVESRTLCMPADLLSAALRECILLLGSAPVGPSTVQRVQKYTQNNLPIVRFGSTETTLQVCGIPYAFPADAILLAFKRGWEHHIVNGSGEVEASVGYYIGQQHPGHTEVKIVKSLDRNSPYYMEECVEGQIGHFVTRGGHIMQGYTNAPTDFNVINEDQWYLKLGDMGFYLVNPFNHHQDLYWQSRDSHMLIRGGANYAYEQVNAELSSFLSIHYNVPSSAFKLAVCGAKLHSEHEDSCCVMVQVLDDATFSADQVSAVEASFVSEAKKKVSKGAKPDYVAFGEIPVVQSKGVINIPDMIAYWKKKAVA